MSDNFQIPNVFANTLKDVLNPKNDNITSMKAFLNLVSMLQKRKKWSLVAAIYDPQDPQIGTKVVVSDDLRDFAGQSGTNLTATIPSAIRLHSMQQQIAHLLVSNHFTLDDLQVADHRNVVGWLVDKVVHDRKGRFPYRNTSTEAFREENKWWPGDMNYKNPREMESRAELNAVFHAIVDNHEMDVLRTICTTFTPATLGRQLDNLISRMKGETAQVTYTKGNLSYSVLLN